MEPNNTPDVQHPKQNTTPVSVIGLLTALAVLLVAVVVLSAYIWYGMQHTPATTTNNTDEDSTRTTQTPANTEGGYTQSEKVQILESLQKNPGGLSEEEKRARLEALQASN